MKRNILTGCSALLLLMASACTKNIDGYKNDPRVYFYDIPAGTTSLLTTRTFSFATTATGTTTDTEYVQVKIEGLAAGHDRTFGAKAIADSSTAVNGVNYKLLPGTVKANSFTGILPVVLYRTTDLKDVTMKLALQMADTADFKAGVIDFNYYLLSWNDNLIKPNNWDTRPGLATYFGVYSIVKYQFIIATLHASAWTINATRVYDATKYTNDQMLDLGAQLKTALRTYNASSPTPLTDEFGLLVTFP